MMPALPALTIDHIAFRALRFLIAFAASVLVLAMAYRALPLPLFAGVVAACMYWLYRVARYSGSWLGWLRVRVREWGNDARQLGLWARLAFTPGRDQGATAAMAHQHQFLQGRIMSPMNIFTVLPLVLALGGVSFGAFNGWRVDRIKAQRDAPCSERELTRGRDGEFNTTREACAALGATAEVTAEWEAYATRLKDERDGIAARVRAEAAQELERARASEERRRAAAARMRRRENETVETALGGGAPDLERSLCELAGRLNCEATADRLASPPPAAASSVPSVDGGADTARPAEPPP